MRLIIGILAGFAIIMLYFYMQPADESLQVVAPEGYVEVTVKDVMLYQKGGVVLLGENASSEVLPIYVAADQAREMVRTMRNIPAERPLTHDLIKKILDNANMRLAYVSIDRLEGEIYYATIAAGNGAAIKIDARPSDSIILALKSGTPIYVHKNLMKEKGVLPERMEIQSFKYETV
ncbi:MAG: bifunctional nuclease family protein [Methanobacteriota archaeon]